MKLKQNIITAIISLLIIGLFALNYIANRYFLSAQEIYKVYLYGDIIGYIHDKDELYNMINQRQLELKDKYHVEDVYPPDTFKIIQSNSYNVTLSSAEEIYGYMAKNGSFTIDGYVVTFKSDKKNIKINLLDKTIFDEAIHNFISAFISDEEYNNYINDTQPVIETVGKIIELMYFDEKITIKKSHVNVNDKIYTDVTDLSQYLLFGDNYKLTEYKVQPGDTIASISEANKLNVQEFLIVNTKYTSEDSLLKIGDKVNITLINPVLTFSYEVNEVSDSTIPYSTKIKYDSSKPVNYSEITVQGVKGITRSTQNYLVKNGEIQQGVVTLNKETIVEKVDEVIVKGMKYSSPGEYIDTGTEWQWPTNYPYKITSGYGYRGGYFHEGIDISGTGYGSPIYAIASGTVINAGFGGMAGDTGGYNVIIDHHNNYWSTYLHMAPGSVTVKVGDEVSRGQIVGAMGHSGWAEGTHLHFGVSTNGRPYRGKFIDPRKLWPNVFN